MKRYKLIVAYDGTDYYGWQAQPGKKTVAGTLQETLAKVFGNQLISIVGASRTDAGVHAQGQVATFVADLPMTPERLLYTWNNLLPESISIKSITLVPEHHSIFADVAYKTYIYSIFPKKPDPLKARYGWWLQRRPFNVALFKQALQLFVGTHDFLSFSTGDERGTDTIRTIDAITITEHEENITVTITGQRFLHHMIRRILGAACDVATRSDMSLPDIERILLEKNPRQRLTNAPAKGLTLKSITYRC